MMSQNMVKRRKMRKNRDKDSPVEKRMKDKNGEVAIARGRLAGALKGILNRNNEDSDEQDSSPIQSSNSSAKKVQRDSSPAQWRKTSKTNENEDHQSYVVKLFDRSVDLAQFDINTPLYPVCRAWIQNKPMLSKKKDEGNGLVEIKHESEDNDDQLFELNEKPNYTIRSNDCDTSILPPPIPLPEGVYTLRNPSPIKREIQEINLNADPDQAPSREELLQSHLNHWIEVRKRWRMASLKNEERYAASKEILTKMFERAQGQFHVPIN